MGEVVDRRPADIHAHIRLIERLEPLLAARQRVVDRQFAHAMPRSRSRKHPHRLAGTFGLLECGRGENDRASDLLANNPDANAGATACRFHARHIAAIVFPVNRKFVRGHGGQNFVEICTLSYLGGSTLPVTSVILHHSQREGFGTPAPLLSRFYMTGARSMAAGDFFCETSRIHQPLTENHAIAAGMPDDLPFLAAQTPAIHGSLQITASKCRIGNAPTEQ